MTLKRQETHPGAKAVIRELVDTARTMAAFYIYANRQNKDRDPLPFN